MIFYSIVYNNKGKFDEISLYTNLEAAKEKVKKLNEAVWGRVGAPSFFYEIGYDEADFPDSDEVCNSLYNEWEKLVVEGETTEARKLQVKLFDAIDEHLIIDFGQFMEEMYSFRKPPENFYGIVRL